MVSYKSFWNNEGLVFLILLKINTIIVLKSITYWDDIYVILILHIQLNK